MTLQIAFDAPGTSLTDDERGGTLILREPDSGSDYATWSFHVDGEDSNMPGPHVWEWENPDEPIEDVTLSPSLRYQGGIGPDFHVFIKNGEVEHCGDCQCGCRP